MSHRYRRFDSVEHFDVVQALARTALGGGRDATSHQIERLATLLLEDGQSKEAESLRGIVKRASRIQSVEPLHVVATTASPQGQKRPKLSPRTPLPVDRDSSAPLCEIIFPGSSQVAPILPLAAQASFESLVHEWRHEDLLYEAGLSVSRSLLLYGLPGTGKTTLALTLASVLGRPAVIARLDGLISSFLGNTARNLGALFEFSNRYDTVLILDEFDAVAKVRDDPNEVGEIKRVVNALLQNLDKRVDLGLTIAITNHEQLLDRAIWRRFEHQIRLDPPNAIARRGIADRHLVHLGSPTSLAKAVTWETERRSGADVKSLVLAIVKARILASEDTPEASLLRAAAQSGARLEHDVLERLDGSDPDLARILLSEGDMSTVEIAQLFGKDRRTVSRWLQ